MLDRPAIVALLLVALSTDAGAQLHSRRLDPPGVHLAGALGAANEAQPVVSALPEWRVGVLSPFVNLYSGGLFLRYSVLVAASVGHDWDLAFYYNSTRASETSTLGKGWRHSYDTALLINTPPGSITVRWGDGRRDVFTPSGGGWAGPASLEGRTIATITGGYRLSTKHAERHEFDTSGRLIRLVDRNNNTSYLTYTSGRLSLITDHAGREVQLAYNGSGRLVSITGIVSQPITLAYVSDRLTSISESPGYPFAYQYDAFDRLVRITDSQSRSTHVAYYASLPVVQWVRASVARREFFFDQATRTTVVRDSVSTAENTQATYTFNVNGTTASVTQVDLGTSTNTYDASTLKLLSHTDPNGGTWTRTYNAVGDVLTVTDPLTETWTWTHDPTYHLPATLTAPGGALWQWLRDANGNLTSWVDPNTNTWSWTYNLEGLPLTATDPNTYTTTFGYSGAWYLSQIQDPAGYTRSFTHDDRGNVTNFYDQVSNQWSVTRNGRDDVIDLSQPGGASWSIDWGPSGQPTSVGDPDSGRTRFQYDTVDRLVRVVCLPEDSTKIERDGRGKPRRVTRGGEERETERDGSGRKKKETDPNGAETEYQYDGLDRVEKILPSGSTEVSVFDAKHRLTERRIGPDSTTYTYDSNDRLVRAERVAPDRPTVTYSYEYDFAGRRTRKGTEHLGRSVEHTYDYGGRLTRMDDNLQSSRWEYSYDNRNRVTGLTTQPPIATGPSDLQMNMGYSQRGLPTSTNLWPLGASIYQDHDALGRLSQLNFSSSWSSGYFYPGYSPRGDLTSYSAYFSSTGNVGMAATYDAGGRVLTEDHSPFGSFTYTHDANGNRLTKDGPGGFENYGYGPGHRLTSAGALTQTWNVNGDVVTSGWPGHPIAYTYRPDRSLATLTDSGSTWHFVPGPFGEIAAVIGPAGDTTWYDADSGPQGLLRRATFSARAAPPAAEYGYIPLNSGTTPRIRKTPGGVEALLPGPFGISDVVDNAGLVSSRYTSMFGEILAQTGAPSATPNFHDMDVLRDPSAPLIRGLSTRDHSGGQPQDIAYLPRIGSFQRDLGLGPDFMASVGLNVDPSRRWYLPHWFRIIEPPPPPMSFEEFLAALDAQLNPPIYIIPRVPDDPYFDLDLQDSPPGADVNRSAPPDECEPTPCDPYPVVPLLRVYMPGDLLMESWFSWLPWFHWPSLRVGEY